MKIVFLERGTLGEDVELSRFEELGEVVYYDLTDPEKNAERIKDADVVVLNKIPVNSSLLDGNDKVKLVCLTATGTNNVDFDYCNKRGIAVRNVAGYSTYSVAQHTFALYFYVAGDLKKYDDFVKNGDYLASSTFSYFYYPFHELYKKTWGIIGLGAIGEKVADIASAFGCRVIYYSTSGKNTNERYERVSLEELLTQSDVVSIHCALTPATEGLINKETLAMMKNSAYIVNLARGAVVNEQDLYDALVEGKIAGAALDVLCKEPMSKDNPLYNIKDSSRLFITPHIGWGTVEARQRCADAVADNIIDFYK